MATNITPGIPDARKQEAAAAICPSGSTYKCALIKAGATLGPIATYAELGANEVANGNGYATGGQVLTDYAAALKSGVASIDWSDPVWDPSAISADGAVVYDAGSGKVCAVLTFPATKTSDGGPFTAQLPSSGVGVIRIG